MLRHNRSMSLLGSIAPALVVIATVGCASAPTRRPDARDARAAAAVQAEVRVVGSETTLVARGTGYELVARTRGDIAALQSALDQCAGAYRRVFGAEPAEVIVAVEHVASDGSFGGSPPPLPTERQGGTAPVVTVLVGGREPGQRSADRRPTEGRGAPRNGEEGGGMRGAAAPGGFPGSLEPAQIVVRAWLSARASVLTSHAAPPAQATGEVEDPRVPSWAEAAIPALSMDSLAVDRVAWQLNAHPDSLYALGELFTMQRPPMVVRQRPPESATEDGGPPSGGRGGMGGMGGRGMDGGRGGRGGMMGGGRGGGRPGTRAVRPMPALQGGALFVAQAMVFGHYLQAREGDRFIGALVDAQMQGQPVASVLASARMVPGDVQRLDEEWRHWLDYQSRNRRR